VQPLAIPEELRRAVHYDLGARRADRWLAALPSVAARYAARWRLDLSEVLAGGRLSLCLAGDGVVLKLPSVAATGRRELAALRAWGGGPAPVVLHGDARAGVIAMERIRPGTTAGPDVDAVAALLAELHRQADGFPSLQDALAQRVRWSAMRCRLPDNDTGRALHARALALLERPPPDMRRPVLLHGDFQEKNLLAAEDGRPRAIDPLPSAGDPAFDAACWCVLQESDTPIDVLVSQLARAAGLNGERVAWWAQLVAALEYRPYRPRLATRIEAFTLDRS
jgi:streptomycin 6-kinase